MAINKVVILGSIPEEVEVFNKVRKGYKWDDKEVIIGVGGVGKASSAAITQKMISEYTPDMIIYTGVAGAISKNLKIGDIAVISHSIDAEMDARSYDSNLKLGQYPFTFERVFSSSPELVRLALEAPLEISRFDGFAATISSFMDTSKKRMFVDEILPELEEELDGQLRRPNVIDMESLGFLLAANNNNIPCLIIKTISNTTQGNAAYDYIKYLWDGVENYLNIVAYILKNVKDN